MKTQIFYSTFFSIITLLNYKVRYCEAVINGTPARYGDFPFMVSLRNETGRHYCGGSLVSSRHVVTAAHCLYADESVFTERSAILYQPDHVRVVADSIDNLPTLADYLPQKIYNAVKLKVHPMYNVMTHSNMYDIGVITLDRDVTNAQVWPIRPAYKFKLRAGDDAWAAGFGADDLTKAKLLQGSKRLNWLDVNIAIQEECAKDYAAKKEPIIAEDLKSSSMFCAYKNNQSGVCVRDSGSPLVRHKQLIGIVIFGKHPCGSGTPDVFTNVSTYYDFIMDIVDEKANNSVSRNYYTSIEVLALFVLYLYFEFVYRCKYLI